MSAKENHLSDTTSEFYKRSFTIAVFDEVWGQLERRFTGNNSIMFEGLSIILNIMIYSVNEGDGRCWRSKTGIRVRPLGKTLESEQTRPP